MGVFEKCYRYTEAKEAMAAGYYPYFTPLHLQPFYRKWFGFRDGDFPVTERVARSTLALPFSSRMSEGQVEVVCQALGEVTVDQKAVGA